jgi:hypothetical protein
MVYTLENTRHIKLKVKQKIKKTKISSDIISLIKYLSTITMSLHLNALAVYQTH